MTRPPYSALGAQSALLAGGGAAAVALPPLDLTTFRAAFGTQLLSTAYAGPLLRVRRSSDSTEQDINASGYDLDTAALLSFVGAGSGFVTTLYDQSGGGRHLTQTTAANQPRIVNAGALETSGGRASLNVHVSNLFLSRNTDWLAVGAFTIYALYNPTSVTSAASVFYNPQCVLGDASANYGVTVQTSGVHAGFFSSGSPRDPGTDAATTGQHVIRFEYDGATATTRVDANSAMTLSYAGVMGASFTDLRVGRGYLAGYVGHISALLIDNTAKGATGAAAVYPYMQQRWGVTTP